MKPRARKAENHELQMALRDCPDHHGTDFRTEKLESQNARMREALEKIVKVLTHPDSVLERVADESPEGKLAVIAFNALRTVAEDALSPSSEKDGE